MSDNVTASAYVVVKAERDQYGSADPETGLKETRSTKIISIRQGRPSSMGKDEVLVKITVQLPKVAFDPITPSALIVVNDDMILDRHQIEVEAVESA